MARRKENPPEAANRPISRITHRRPKPPHVKREPKFRVEINQLNRYLGPSMDRLETGPGTIVKMPGQASGRTTPENF